MATGFNKQNERGLVAQEIVKQHLESRGHTVIDVSADKDYQKIDVDFIVKNCNQQVFVEVKGDYNLYKYGNILFEAGKQRGNNYYTGWLFKCEADYLCVYDNTCRRGLIIDFPRTKEILAETAMSKTFYDRYDDCMDRVYLLPIAKARQLGLIIYQWED